MPNYVNQPCAKTVCDGFTATGTDLERGDLVLTCPDDQMKRFSPVTISTDENGNIIITDQTGNETITPNPETIAVIIDNGDGTVTIETFGTGNGGSTPPITIDPNNPSGITITDNGDGTITIDDGSGTPYTVSTGAGGVDIVDNGDGTYSYTNPGDSQTIVWCSCPTFVDNGDGTVTITSGTNTITIPTGFGPSTPVSISQNGSQVTVVLADGSSFTFDATISTGSGAPILSGTFPALTQGVAMAPFTLSNAGGPVNSWAIISGTLPAGLTFSTVNGQFAGTPTTSGSTPITVEATNGSGTDTHVVTIVVTASLAAPDLSTSAAIPDMTQGLVITPYNPTNTGGAATSWSATGLPAGVTINTSTGQLTGTPTTTGTFNIGIIATNTTGSDTFNDTVVVNSNNLSFPATQTVTATTTDGSEAISQLWLLDNGGSSHSLLNGSTSGPNWYTPTTVGIGSQFEVRWTLVSGSALLENAGTGGYGTWYTVGDVQAGETITPRPVLRTTGGTDTSVVTMEIREIANTANISTTTLTLNTDSSGGSVQSNSNISASYFDSALGSTGTAFARFESDGTIDKSTGPGSTQVWYAPTTVGIGSDYEIMLDNPVGLPFTSSNLNTWINIGTNPQFDFFMNSSGGFKSGTMDFTIRDVLTQTTQASGTVQLSGEVGGL